jgi:hypothetical protein
VCLLLHAALHPLNLPLLHALAAHSLQIDWLGAAAAEDQVPELLSLLQTGNIVLGCDDGSVMVRVLQGFMAQQI